MVIVMDMVIGRVIARARGIVVIIENCVFPLPLPSLLCMRYLMAIAQVPYD